MEFWSLLRLQKASPVVYAEKLWPCFSVLLVAMDRAGGCNGWLTIVVVVAIVVVCLAFWLLIFVVVCLAEEEV